MPTEMIDLNHVRTYTDGKLQLFVGFCEKIGLPQIINQHMQNATGRPMDIPPGVEAVMLMAPMAEEGYIVNAALSFFTSIFITLEALHP